MRFKDNMWTADITEMEISSSKNGGVKYLLYVVDVFTKYAWVKILKNKNAKTALNGFIGIVNVNQINYGLIKEKSFSIALLKNG